MRLDVSFKYLAESGLIKSILDKDIEKIERRIRMFRDNSAIHLSVHIEKNPHREQYFCRVHLYMPARMLKAERYSPRCPKAINQAFAAISRQLGKTKFKVERHLRKQRGVSEAEE